MPTRGPGLITLGVLLHAILAGCTPTTLPGLLGPPLPESDKTGPTQPENLASSSGPHEASAIVPGSPTQVYALVARGALGCWFSPGGPLKASHVFRAEAEPPAKGGGAEILIHERDRSFRDQRGVRAYRIAFASEITGVRIDMTALKFEAARAQAMAKDVETWAKGGSSCQLRALVPPPAPAKGKVVKGPAAGKAR
jgi:hypothetical protein